jgi:hypothetical protein
VEPGLTSLQVPADDAGTAAVELLVQRIADRVRPRSTVLLRPTLVERGSTSRYEASATISPQAAGRRPQAAGRRPQAADRSRTHTPAQPDRVVVDAVEAHQVTGPQHGAAEVITRAVVFGRTGGVAARVRRSPRAVSATP